MAEAVEAVRDFPISASVSLAVPRYGCVFFLDLEKSFFAICIVNFVTDPYCRGMPGKEVVKKYHVGVRPCE